MEVKAHLRGMCWLELFSGSCYVVWSGELVSLDSDVFTNGSVCSTPPAPHIISPFARCLRSCPFSAKFLGKDYGLRQAETNISLLTLRRSVMITYVDQTPVNLFPLRYVNVTNNYEPFLVHL